MPTIPPNNTSGLYGIDGSSIPIDNNLIANNISATGNVTVDGFLLVDGSITTNANFVGNLVGNLIGNIALAGSNTQVIFNDSGVTGGSNAFTFNKATNSVAVTGTVSATGNITGDYIFGNGSQLTGLPATYSNANVISLLATFGSNTISTSGNITGGYILGNGSQLTGLPQQYGNANVSDYLASGNNTQNIVTTATVQGSKLQTSGGGGNITGANYIAANYFVGDGSLLTNISANLAGNLSGNLTGNGFGLANMAFLSVTGTTTLDDLTVSGSSTIDVGNNRITNVATPSSGTDAATKDYVDSTSSSGFTIADSTANTTVVSGGDTLTLLGSNNQVSVAITATDQVTFSLPTNISVAGNITGGNVLTPGLISATGNLFAGNGNITNDLTVGGTIFGTFSGNIAGNLVVPGANTEILFNNAGNAGTSSDFRFDSGTQVMLLNGTANVIGNVLAGNVTTAGLMSATGNITANTALKTPKWTISGNVITSPNGGRWYSDEVNLDEYLTSRADGYIDLQALYANSAVGSEVHLEHGLAHISTNPGIDPKYWYFYGNGLMTAAGAISTTGDVTAGNIIANGQFLTNLPAANVTGTVANATYALSANTATFAGTVTTNAQPNITSVGTLTSVSSTGNITGGNLLTGGVISATGNVTANYYFGNGSQLTGIVTDYSNANVANYLPTYSGNIGAGNITFVSNTGLLQVNEIQGLAGAGLTIAADGAEDINLNADTIRVGDNNADATIASHGAGDLVLRTHLGDASQGNIILRDGASGNIDIQTNGSGVVNITGTAGLRVADGISAVGNVTANYFLGNGSQLTGVTTGAGGSNTQIQFNDSGAFAGNANVTFNKATGNLSAGNIVLQTATDGTLGVYQNWLQQTNPWPGNSTTTAEVQKARYLFGAGLGANSTSVGDFSTTYDPLGAITNSRVLIADRIRKGNVNTTTRALMIHNIIDIDTPGTTATNARYAMMSGLAYLVGGNIAPTSAANVFAQGMLLSVGNTGNITGSGPANLTLASSFVATVALQDTTSRVGTGIAYQATMQNFSGNNSNYGNYYGITGSTLGGNASTNNYALVYLQNGSGNNFGMNQLPTTYRFLNNQDWRSSSVIGPIESSLNRVYSIGTTTGNITIEWPNGTTQYLKPTGNVTLAYANATVSSNGNLVHTVNLIIEQGTTAYTVTLPTGNANIKYASGNSTVPSTANAVTFINVAAGNINGVTKYMTSIGPEYT